MSPLIGIQSGGGQAMILYACAAAGDEILAEHDPDPSNPLRPLAAQCLRSAPALHALYTHTVRGRIYAFLIDNKNNESDGGGEEEQQLLVFFAIAEESFGRTNALLFLHRLCESYMSEAHPPDFSKLALSISSNFIEAAEEEEQKEREGSGAGQALSPSLRESDTKGKRRKRENSTAAGGDGVGSGSDDGQETEIAVVECERPKRPPPVAAAASATGRRKSVDKIWRQNVRYVIILDVVICGLMFVVWLTLCRGLECMR